MDKGIDDIKNYADQMNAYHAANKAQAIGRLQDFSNTSQLHSWRPWAEEQGSFSYKSYDQNYVKAVASEDARLKEAIKAKRKMSKEEIKSMLKSRGIELNPPVVKQDSWEARVGDYASKYEL